MDLISIIIPVYNAEQYLEHSIDSALKQTYKNIEVILIDDGSVDNSNKICLNFCKKDSRVKYFNNNNKGVSSARNYGIEKSKGSWICFLDADDWIEPHLVERLYNLSQKYNVEIVQAALRHSTIKRRTKFNSDGILFDNIEIIKMLLSPFQYSKVIKNKNAKLLNSTQGCYGKLFSKKLIETHNITFPLSTGLGEDMLFYYNCLLRVSKIVILDEQLYNYRVHMNSTTQKCNNKLPIMLKEFLNTIKELENKSSYKDYEIEWKYAIVLHLKLVLNMYYWNEKNTESKKSLEKSLREILYDPIVQSSLRITKLKYLTNFKLNYDTISYLLKIQFLKWGMLRTTFNISKFDYFINKVKIKIKNILYK